jgi:hypothetical protein
LDGPQKYLNVEFDSSHSDDMRGTRFVTLFVVCIFLSVYTVVIGSTTGATYQLGDYWEYNIEEYYDDYDMDGSMRLEVTGWENVRVSGTVYETTVLTQTGSGTFSGSGSGVSMDGTWESTGKANLQTSNDEMIVNVLDLSMEGTLTFWGGTYDYEYTAHNETTYNLIVDTKASSLSQGDLGTCECIVTYEETTHMEANGNSEDSSEDGTYHEETIYNCSRMETVTVVAGTFETYVVNVSYSDGSYLLDWQSERVGAPVKGEEYNADGELVVSTELTSYRFGQKATETEDNRLLGISYDRFGFCLLVIFITIIIIVALVLASRGKKNPVKTSSQTVRDDGPRVVRIQQPPRPGEEPPFPPPQPLPDDPGLPPPP